MATKQAPTGEAAIFSRIFQGDQAVFSPDAARSLLALDFSAEDKRRMRALAAKAREGKLTPQEQTELDNYGKVGSLLGIMKSRARKYLKDRGDSNGTASPA
jgi:hypothetical protein